MPYPVPPSILTNNKFSIIPDFMPLAPPLVGIAPFVKPLPVNPFHIRKYWNPNDDPELHHNVIKFFMSKLKDVWLTGSMSKLLKFIKIENGQPVVVRSVQQFENNNDSANQAKKVDYILDKVFGKYELEALLTKLAMEYSINWYDMKGQHYEFVKKQIYRKIKHSLVRYL